MAVVNWEKVSNAEKEKIRNICDHRFILLSDGDTIEIPSLNIIYVINIDNNSDIRNKLPSNLLYSIIYHKINEFSEDDIEYITKEIFRK